MAQAEDDILPETDRASLWPQRRRWRITLAFLAVLILALIYGWATRERIAGNIIEEQLRDYDLPATYDIGSISPDRQVLRNIVIGDPERPDFTAERVIVHLRYRLGTPAIGRVELFEPRLFGTYRDGELSFGALDPLVFAESDEPAGLPDLDLKLVDGRALIQTDYGDIGIKAEGEGELDHGFTGVMAAIAPDMTVADCRIERATLFGQIAVDRGKPSFDGPARFRGLRCASGGANIAALDAQSELVGEADFSAFAANLDIRGQDAGYGETLAHAVNGKIRAEVSAASTNARFDLAGDRLSSPQLSLASFAMDGSLRARDGFDRAEIEADITGEGTSLGSQSIASLGSLAQQAEGTLAAPLLEKLQRGLARELNGGDIAARVSVKQTGSVITAIVPEARLGGASGATVLGLSRVQYSTAGSGVPRLTGNLVTGGRDIPQIQGRMEQRASGDIALRLRMEEYSAGNASLALPQMMLVQSSDGAIGFSGNLVANGALPGGAVRELVLPVSGNWSSSGGLALGRRCTDIRFASLAIADLELDRRSLTLCPPRGASIVAFDDQGLRIAAGAPSLDLSGRLADTPIRLQSGAVGMAWPGQLSARNVDIALGPEGTASRFTISELDASLGEKIAGTFSEADVSLDAIPLDIRQASGSWQLVDSVLLLDDGSFRLSDREAEARFEPLVARDATLRLADNVVTAEAALRNPASDRIVTRVDIAHNLSTSTGHADLVVDGLRFDDQLQPDELTNSANGVIELADGVVTGTGRIDWNEDEVTSSGQFSSEAMDFAAAFGPVQGASGTIEFTDLLNLTTAPGQTLKIAAINPGIEVLDGEITFDIRDGQFIGVRAGSWPFMGGTLTLRPVELNMGISEARSYVFEIIGLEAAKFVETLELGNLSARGVFDGTVPLIFDADGNGRVEGGLLISRPPGGNLAYVGELTYEDLGTMANFAFQSLRSLDFRQMQVEMEGPLTGEIVTRLRFDGITQGEEADSNFLTRRIAKLPIQFRVNIRAPFYELISNLKAMYDPALVRDPRELGLLDAEDGRFIVPDAENAPEIPQSSPVAEPQAESPIQTQESETMP